MVPPTQLRSLSLRNFRNIPHADLAFPACGAVIVGDNGQGKTNLLEAIAYLGTLRSVRAARDRDLVRHGAALFSIRASAENGSAAEISIGVDRPTGRKRITIDGVEAARQADALGVIPSVSWSPADVALIAGAPAERRRYLDVMLALSSRPYVNTLRQYRAALERRNATIRDVLRRGSAESAIAAWEPALAEHGAAIIARRREWVREHAAEFARLATSIGELGRIVLSYECGIGETADGAQALAAALSEHRARDLHRGMTCTGPHRDDVTVAIDGHDLRTFGSAGQQRTAAIALRLLEARTIRSGGRGQPLVLLDDPFAELDSTRAARTLELLVSDSLGQVILAVPREDEIPATFQALPRWRMRGGVVSA